MILRSLLLIAILNLGCGSERLYPVEGRVTLNGKALVSGDIVLYPDDGRALPSDRIPMGKLSSGGEYRITSGGKPGAVAGTYRVTIVAQTKQRPKNQPANPMGIYPAIDAKYLSAGTTPLRLTVRPNPTAGAYDFEIPD